MPDATLTHDEYISAAPEFARPILTKLRAAVKRACPQADEAIRWGHPGFDHDGMLVSMAAHKGHVNFIFAKGKRLDDPAGILTGVGTKSEMALVRIEALAELPTQKVLVSYIRSAMKLNRNPASVQASGGSGRTAKRPAARVAVPADLAAALKRSQPAAATFAGFSPSNRRDYVDWLTEAKRESTRARRLAQAIEWMAEGKPRNWKYIK